MVAIFYSLIMNLMLGIRFSPSENEQNQHECTDRRDSFSTVANGYLSHQKNVPILPGLYVQGGFQTNTRGQALSRCRRFFKLTALWRTRRPSRLGNYLCLGASGADRSAPLAPVSDDLKAGKNRKQRN